MTENLTNRLYAIGDKQTGILFVTLDPLRVSYISTAEIAAFAAYKGGGATSSTVFADIKISIWDMFKTISTAKADFCYVADLLPGTWQASRIPFPPLFDALDFLAGRPDHTHPLPVTCQDPNPDGLHAAWLVKETEEHECRQYVEP